VGRTGGWRWGVQTGGGRARSNQTSSTTTRSDVPDTKEFHCSLASTRTSTDRHLMLNSNCAAHNVHSVTKTAAAVSWCVKRRRDVMHRPWRVWRQMADVGGRPDRVPSRNAVSSPSMDHASVAGRDLTPASRCDFGLSSSDAASRPP